MNARAHTPTPFQQKVEELRALEAEVRSMTSNFGDARDQKLSAKAYLREAMANGKTNEAKQFEEFVGSPEGRAIMRKHGFLLPGDPIPSK